MHTLIGASTYGTLRARDGANWAVLNVLSGISAPGGLTFSAGRFMAYGPGVSPAVPRSRLYWLDGINGVGASSASVWWTNGVDVTNMAFDPANGGFDLPFDMVYDPATDRLYVCYQGNAVVAGPCGAQVYRFYASYWDGSAWTNLPTTRSIGGNCGCIGIIPATALVGAGQLIAGWGQDCSSPNRNVIQRYDGAAWVDEYYTAQGTPTPTRLNVNFLAPWADKVIGCLFDDSTGAPWSTTLVVQRDGAGVWTDITPAVWAALTQKRRAVCAVEYDGDLYVSFRTQDNVRREIWKRAAATGTWTLDLDLAVALPPDGWGWSLQVIDEVLYVGMDDAYVGNDFASKAGGTSGAWTITTLPTNLQPPYVESSIQFFLEAREGTVDPAEGNCSGESAPTVHVYGFWDSQQFVAWDPTTVWVENRGIWSVSTTPSAGTIVYCGTGAATAVDYGYIGQTPWQMGEIDVLDPFVLSGIPSNGRGLANVIVSNAVFYDHVQPFADFFPLYLPNGYEYLCPEITSVDPASATINGGVTITLHGTNFFANQITPSAVVNQVYVVNRIWIRTAAGVLIEVDPYTITFVDEETIEFPCPPYPGGTDPAVEILFRPAGLAPFSFALPYGIYPTYRCPVVTGDFTYTGLIFALLGSLETVLGLGGTGGDVSAPGAPGGLGGHPACPAYPAPGPCVRP